MTALADSMALQGLGCGEGGVALGPRAAGEPEGQRRRVLLAEEGAQEGAGPGCAAGWEQISFIGRLPLDPACAIGIPCLTMCLQT